MMKTKRLLSVTILTLLAGFAYAGLVQPAPVSVDLVNMFAQGDQFTARTSAGDTELIGCGTRSIDNGTGNPFGFGFCQAADAEGDEITCFTQRDKLMDEMRATSAYAYITFAWDENGDCVSVGFSTQSFYLPKK